MIVDLKKKLIFLSIAQNAEMPRHSNLAGHRETGDGRTDCTMGTKMFRVRIELKTWESMCYMYYKNNAY